jgi:hypothetical protein
MPARKPRGLITRHDTQADKAARIERETALESGKTVPIDPPARLAKHEVAGTIWRRLMRLYGEIEATVVTRLDMDMLCDYCILMEQVTELDQLRKSSYVIWQQLDKKRIDCLKKGDVEESLEYAIKAASTFEMIVKLDSRGDRKRALLLQWRQSLYLTPRARAGAAAERKEKPPEIVDPLEALLNDVTGYVNGESK